MFPKKLKNNFEIADYIATYSSKYVDKRLIEDYFIGCKALLKEEFLENMTLESEDNHIKDQALEDKYLEYPVETMPPLIVEDGIVLDGNHRFRVLKKLNIEKTKVYEIIS